MTIDEKLSLPLVHFDLNFLVVSTKTRGAFTTSTRFGRRFFGTVDANRALLVYTDIVATFRALVDDFRVILASFTRRIFGELDH